MSIPHILLVEDYAPGMLVTTLMIENLGYVVEAVSSGSRAIEKVREARSPFLAILMDVNMHEMSGFQATQIIRAIETEKGYSNTIIAATAYALSGDRNRCLEAGMDDYISKPLHPDILATKLAALAETFKAR